MTSLSLQTTVEEMCAVPLSLFGVLEPTTLRTFPKSTLLSKPLKPNGSRVRPLPNGQPAQPVIHAGQPAAT